MARGFAARVWKFWKLGMGFNVHLISKSDLIQANYLSYIRVPI